MKKFLTLALALVMALALAAPAMAFIGDSDDKTLEGYNFDFYLVEYERNDYFGGDDVIVTDLPETDRGYVTNEVVCAMIVAEIEEDAMPAGKIDMTVTGDNVFFLDDDEPMLTSATVAKKAADDGYDWDASATDNDEYNFIWNDDDAWELFDPDQTLFEGYASKDVTLRWLVFAKVTDDEASLKLTIELDGVDAAELRIDGKQGTACVGMVRVDTGSDVWTVQAYEYKEGTAAPATISNGNFAADDTADKGVYEFSSSKYGTDLALYVTYDKNYRAWAMILKNDTVSYLVDKNGGLHAMSANTVSAAADITDVTWYEDGAYDVIGADADVTVTDYKADGTAVNFLKDICDEFGLNPARQGSRMRPADIGSAAEADETLELTIDIEPWQAFVTIPDIEVVDPPKTGDAATLAGFVMIVLAAAGVVVFKKVRA